MAFHRPGNALLGLLGCFTQEPLAQDDPKHQGDEHDDDRSADELGQGELPAQQQKHDHAKLDDQVGRSDLERHGRGEVCALAKQRPRQRHGGIRARRGRHSEPGGSNKGPGAIIAHQPNHGGVSYYRLDDC